MIIDTIDINTRHSSGIKCLTDVVYDRYTKELYALQQSLNKQTAEKLLLLLFAVEMWDNTQGSVNLFTEKQLLTILDNIVMVQSLCACKSTFEEEQSSNQLVSYLTGEDMTAILTEEGSLILL